VKHDRRLSANWQSLGAIWGRLNDPSRHPTPQVTIEAILYCIRMRGLAALKEPANRERLKHCDQSARDEINWRIGAMLEKGIIPNEPAQQRFYSRNPGR
jgi:hypothetical protein